MIQKQLLTSVLQNSFLRSSRSQMFFKIGVLYFNSYLAIPRPTLSHFRGYSLINPMLMTAFVKILQYKCFHLNIAKFFRTPFLQNTSVDCFCCLKKSVNFPGKLQWRRPNTFVFLMNTTE